MRLFVQYLLIVGCLAASQVEAQAWDRGGNQSSVHAAEAHRYYNGGDFRNAIIKFLQAYKEDEDFRHLYYVAVSQSRMRNYQQAITFYLRYMQKAGDHISADDRLSINHEIERLRAVAIGGPVAAPAPPAQRQSYRPAQPAPAPTRDLQAEYRARIKRERDLMEQERARTAAQEGRQREKAEKKATEGRRFFSQRRYSRAGKAFTRAYRISPNPFYLWDMARVAAKLKDYEGALDLYNQFIGQIGGKISKEHQDTVKYEMAVINKNLAESERKKEAEGRVELGIALIEKNEFGRALNELAKAYKIKPEPNTLYHLARAQEGLGQIAEAKQSYQNYLATPGKAVSKRKRRTVEKTIKKLAKLEQDKLAKQRAVKQTQAAKKLARAGKHEQALQTYGQAYRYYPDPHILFNIGESASAMKKYDMAIDAYTQFLSGAGSALHKTRRTGVENIIAQLRAAAEKEQNQLASLALVLSGQAHNKGRSYKLALKDFQNAYAVFPSHDTLFHIAVTQSLLREHAYAITTYRQYLDEGRGKIAVEKRKLVNQEIKRLEGAYEANAARRESKNLYKSGRSLVAGKDYAGAADEFRAAYEMAPNYEILYSLAQAEAAQSNNTDALEAYKQFLSLGGGRIAPNQRAKVRQEIYRLIAQTNSPIE